MTILLKPKTSPKNSFSKITFFKKSGARLYLPEKIIGASTFPFKDGDVLKIEIAEGALKLRSAEWWELLDWETMPQAFKKLPKDIQEKITVQT